MPTSINSSGITFPDATTQTTRAINTNANVNSVSAGTGISVNATTGAVTVTNAGVTSVAAGTGISVSASTGGITITNTAPNVGSGTVTSVATGNGLQGGTITTSGTLSVACPGFNTVGSYVMARGFVVSGGFYAGSNYAAGVGLDQLGSSTVGNSYTNNLSGTWKWMGDYSDSPAAIACRVA